jgi:uncharacterized protein YdaU (DUF1376 family)
MAELPIMPLKTDALLADTTHMSAEEFGVYCRLLFVMWRHGGKLKDNDAEMATIGGVTLRRWMTIKEKVMRPMTALGGLVSQGRLTDTWIQVQELRKKRALAADIRWRSKPHAKPMQVHSISNANQNQNIEPSVTEDRPSERREMQKGISKGSFPVSPELEAVVAAKKW